MATLSEIRDALQGYLEEIEGLHAYDTWPGTINPPAALVRPTTIDYSESFTGNNTYAFEIVLAVRMTNLRSSQNELDLYLSAEGPRSIRAHMDAGQSLGGAVNTVNVLRMHDYGELDINGAHFLGAILDVEIID